VLDETLLVVTADPEGHASLGRARRIVIPAEGGDAKGVERAVIATNPQPSLTGGGNLVAY
jgi:hypothetical protein